MKKVIDFTIVVLFFPVLVSGIMGGCQVQSYFRRTSGYHKEPIKLGHIKIDSLSYFSSASSVKGSYDGHGYILEDTTIRKRVSLGRENENSGRLKGHWRQYLEENSNILPIWYSNYFQMLDIPPKKDKEEVLEKLKKSHYKWIIIFFTPLVIYILFILGYKYISKKRLINIILLGILSTPLSAQSLIYDYNIIIKRDFPIQISVYIYDPPLQAKQMNIPESNFQYQYPEEFFMAYAGATSNDWMKSLLLDTTFFKPYPEDVFETIKKGEGPEFHLVAKLDFKVGEDQFALVKFRLHASGLTNPPVGAYCNCSNW